MSSVSRSPQIHLAATFTAEPLKPVMETWLKELGYPCKISFAPFNQVFQQLLDPASSLSTNAGGVNVILIRKADLGCDRPERTRSVVRELVAALEESTSRDGIRTLVLPCPSPDKEDDDADFIADLTAELKLVKAVEVLDPEMLARLYPVESRFDSDSDETAKIPYTDEMFAAMATFLVRRLVISWRKPCKVIAVDCDHTLWSGVCGEVGPLGVEIDSNRQEFQRFLQARRDEGYLLCLVSKNRAEDVEAVFRENPAMVLKRDAFVDAAINWEPKSSNLKQLAHRLGLGLDGFLFLDDNPAEIAEVAANAPAVLPILVPDDSAKLVTMLDHLWILDRNQSSVEDAKRADFYHQEARRIEMRQQTSSYEEFIQGLNLELDILPLDETNLERASQLTQRTNQFNATPNPRDLAEIMSASRGMLAELVSVRDRFGDYGVVGLMMSREDGGRWWVETFLLSCRALGKGVEQRMLRHLAGVAASLGLNELAISFSDSGRNQPCRDFLESLASANWENGLRVVSTQAAAECSLISSEKPASEATSLDQVNPVVDPLLAAKCASELQSAAAILGWATGPVKSRPELGEAFVRPLGDTQEAIAAIWCSVLGMDSVGSNDRFVDLGGSSLDLVRVHAQLQRKFGRRIELVSLFEAPTIATQAQLLDGKAPTLETPESKSHGHDAIAIIGMGVRLPGASSPEELWHNLLHGVESITQFDRSELEVPGGEGDPNFVCARGLLDPEVYEGLDGGLFGIVPREAEMIDPQHRVFLEICWEALERGGYVPDDAEASGNRIGVYAGCYYDTYAPHHILSDDAARRRHLEEVQVGALQVEFGNDKDHLATRVAFKLNLKGPSLSVQTACSSSLVAVAHAVMAIRSGQCDMALAGGVTVTVPQKRGYHHEEGGMLSKDGRCRPFDEESSGTVFSNGAGVVLLKRLADAERDGDHIHAILRGFGMNNDGGVKHSYAAPSADGQSDAIHRAHLDAGIDPATITYVEAHGTATPLGDPIEVAGLTAAFRQATEKTNFCALGSLKSNLGHLDTAAGVCGLIKTVLSLEHGELPALMHFNRANPRIDFANTPFFINDERRSWTPAGGLPRRAGVSSFGVGGTNVHVVLEQAPAKAPITAPAKTERVMVLSGRNEKALLQLADRLAEHAEKADDADFAASVRTMAVSRKVMPSRAAVVASDWSSAAEALKTRRWVKSDAPGNSPELVWMFPGQGAQFPGMVADLYAAEPEFRADVDRSAELLKATLGEDLRETLFSKDGEEAAERLKHTVLAQPAIFVVEHALARQWQRWGMQPTLMLGHSVGEFTAACLAGVFSLEDALHLLAERGRLMGEVAAGSMLSVRLSADQLLQRLPDDLDLAADNGPELCVVAGESTAVSAFAKQLEADGVNVRELHTSHAFHSRMMDPVVDRFRQVLEKIILSAPSLPILSTVTGKLLTDEEACDPGYWAGHLRKTVGFRGALQAAAEPSDGKIFLEVGPGQTLTTLARQTVGRRSLACLASCEHPAKGEPDRLRMLQTLGELWCRGVAVDWLAVHHDIPAHRVPLPTYPFQRKRHWLPCRILDQPIVLSPQDVAVSQIEPTDGTTVEEVSSTAQPAGLLDQAREVLEDLSGIPAEEMAAEASFLELGFDSLLLTQAARELQKAFGIAISFRDLMQNFPTLGSLAAHLEANVTQSDKEAVKPAAPTAKVVEVQASDEPEVESGVSGPRTRIDRVSTQNDLTEKQQSHLDALTKRYNAKTAKSKELTQQYRPWHADPRTVNGFNRLWKEMVYQVVANRMKGSKMWDVDGNEYIDMVNGFGPNFLGHSPDYVTEAIQAQLATGLEIGPQCEAAMETSKLFCEATGNERVCFLNTGSEAVQAAMRISRTVTGRDKILVFDKDYHGNFDPVLVRSVGKGARRRTLPLAPGIPDAAVGDVIVVPWGKPEALEMIREVAHELAAVLVEPVQSRQPELIPIDFVHEVKKISEEHGFLLVFDEVITGLRQGLGGAQELYGIRADLATYGKVFGGGALPIGVIGGKAKYMDTFDGGFWQYGDDSFPEKEVTFFAGTFVRLPLAMAACRAVLKYLMTQGPEYWDRIRQRADRLAKTVDRLFRDQGIEIRMVNFGSQMYLRIGDHVKHGNLVYYHLREKGIFAMEGLPFYLTAEHTDADVDRVIEAFRETIAELQEGEFFAKPPSIEFSADRVGARGPFPMTEPMSEIWLASLMGNEANLAFNEMLQLRLQGPANRAAIELSIQDLVDRHDALRMRLPDPHSEAFVIDPAQTASVIFENLTGVTDQAEAVRKIGESQRETPFDLAHGPLFRVVIIQLSDLEWVLQFAAHHIACDGWSFEVLVQEFQECYQARVAGKRPILKGAPSVVDRALRHAGRAVDSTDLTWWEQYFASGVSELDLPLDHDFGLVPDYASATCEVTFDGQVLKKLRKLAATCGATLNSTMLAGFQAFLHQLSGQDEFVMTFPVAGQMQDGDERLVGHCVNFLPLLAKVDGRSTFKELTSHASAQQMDAIEHGSLTYGQLLRALKVDRDGGRRPLMEYIFNFEPSGDLGAFAGLETKVETVAARYSNSTIFLNIMQLPDGLLLSSTYNRLRLDESTMLDWLNRYCELLLKIAEEPNIRLSNFTEKIENTSIATEDWSTTELPEISGSISDRFRNVCAEHSERTALSWKQGNWSYTELAAKVSSIASALARSGVTAGDCVGIDLPRSPELIASVLAVLEAGGCYVPVDSKYPDARKKQIFEEATVKVVISDASLDDDRVYINPNHLPDESFALVARGPEDPAYVLFTSGSTGIPKGAVIPHQGVLRLVGAANYCDLGPDEILLQGSTIAFDAATFEIFGALLNGGRLVLGEPESSLADLAATVKHAGVTTLWLTAGLFELMVEEHLDELRNVRQLLAGGDVISPSHANLVLGELPNLRLINGYGPTENTTFTTCHTIRKEDVASGTIPIGKPIAGTSVYILDQHGRPCAIGKTGELCCGGSGLALGYLNQPKLSDEVFVMNPLPGHDGERMYRTGDLCRWRKDGTVEFMGRKDDQVKIRGYRIEIREIERVLLDHPRIRQCKVAVDGDGSSGKRLLAWFVGDGAELGVSDLKAWIGERLPSYMEPDRFLAVDRMPVNANGKIDVKLLPRPKQRDASVHQMPEGAVEIRLGELWEELLGIEEIARDDDFFEAGGNSLMALRMFSRIRRDLGVSLPLSTLLKARTIRLLSTLIEAGAHPDEIPSTPALADHLVEVQGNGELPPIFAIHGGDGGILFYRELANRLPDDRPFYAIESPDLGSSEVIELESIEQTAAKYIELIRATRPNGPYLLAGYSYGGVMAYEMARQLSDAGENVPFLALFDTVNPAVEVREYSFKERVSVYWQSQGDQPLLERIKTLAGRFRDGIETNRRVKSEQTAAVAAEPASAHTELRAIQLREAHYNVMRRYRPTSYAGKLTLFRASSVNDKFEVPEDYGWSSLVNSMDVVDVPGGHLTMFAAGNAEPLAQEFKKRVIS
ncbi:amino acid adenylation domain-containing protein [Luteolibacter pohnpeiensis]|uniref:Amino acid adenylation domain-containing protein n=1 Tax=Luteolibacter pohnpeiensis TaxID=454153 RepID=A0A934VW26_9BACT|nr:non-ribosomal peptide synthetase/type I polyketide synthase [Luteolibacter pohnpeiensis]MBK1882383.1 amino acid adenylation domain-containing protein [Luteolibacter pohnpeiensis]